MRHALFVLICPCFNQYCFLQVTQHQTLRHFLPHTQVLPSTHSGTSLHTLRHFLPRTQALPSTHSGTSFHTLRHFLPHTQALSSTHSGTSFHTLRYFLPHTQVLPRTQALPSTQSGTSFMYLELGVTQRHTHTHTTHTHTHTGAPATTAVCGEEVEKYKAATRYSEKHSTETNSISREQKDGRSSRDRWYAGRVAYNAKPCTESMQLTISSVHIELLRPPAWHNCST